MAAADPLKWHHGEPAGFGARAEKQKVGTTNLLRNFNILLLADIMVKNATYLF